MRLRQQLDFLDKRVEEAVAVEENSIREQEVLEFREILDFNVVPEYAGPLLDPTTQSALDDLPDSFQDAPFPGVISSRTNLVTSSSF